MLMKHQVENENLRIRLGEQEKMSASTQELLIRQKNEQLADAQEKLRQLEQDNFLGGSRTHLEPTPPGSNPPSKPSSARVSPGMISYPMEPIETPPSVESQGVLGRPARTTTGLNIRPVLPERRPVIGTRPGLGATADRSRTGILASSQLRSAPGQPKAVSPGGLAGNTRLGAAPARSLLPASSTRPGLRAPAQR